MNYQHQKLKQKINEVCRQWKRVIFLKGASQVVLATLAVFLLFFALDSIFELDTFVRVILLGLMVGVFVVLSYIELIRPLMHVPNETQLARFLEEKHPNLEDRLVTAVELGGAEDPRASQAIFEKLLDDTRFHVEPLNLASTVKSRSASIWSGAAALGMVILVGLLFLNFDFFSMRSNRLLTPWEFPTIKPKPELAVFPGDARVPKGSPQQIRAELTAFEAEAVNLYYSDDDSSWQKVAMDLTMDAKAFEYNFFDLQQNTRYYVKADERLSDIYTFSVYEAPKIRRVDLILNYADFTGMKTVRQRNSGDVWAPEGTAVTIQAIADKPLTKASILMSEGKALKTQVKNDTVVVASFTVQQDDYYKISITDRDNMSNDPPPEYFVHAQINQAPILTLKWPGRDISASMLEEVPVRVEVQDDFGKPQVVLKYVVNSTEEQSVPLQLRSQPNQTEQPVVGNRTFEAEHMFYLEALQVKPGDFINYYVEARDTREEAGNSIASDIFFIEVRPYEKEFTRPVSQDGQMAGGAGSMGGRLSKTQKEIIVATSKTAKKRDAVEPANLANDIQILIDSQENLQEVTQSTLFQMEQRSVFTRDVGEDVTKYYGEAVEAMARALKELRDEKLMEAQSPQREALHKLLLAEAQIKEVQLQQSQAQGQGNNASLEELAQLFEEEMGKLNNKYETLQENRAQDTEENMNDALDKVRELARRQQQFNRDMQDLARQNLESEEKKRRVEELRREQERIRRETQQLSQQMQQLQRENRNVPQSVQEQLRQASAEMNNASHNLNNDNTELAAAKGTRALNRLSRLEEMLQRNQKESLRRGVDDLEQRFKQMTEAQRELTEEVENLAAQSDQGKQAQLQGVKNKQQNMRRDLSQTQEELQSLNDKARRAHNELAREVRRVTKNVEQNGLEEKMAAAEKMLQENKLNSAAQAERDILSQLEQTRDELTKLRGALAESQEEKLDLALDQTRKMRESLEALQRQSQQLKRQQGASGEQQSGEQQESAGRTAESSQAGPGEAQAPSEQLDPAKLDWMKEELARNIKDMEFVQQSLASDTSLTQSASNLNQNMESVLRTFAGGDPERFDEIEEQVLIPLRALEAELAQKLELLKNKEKLFLAREERIPAEYKELVEKYYEALSETDRP